MTKGRMEAFSDGVLAIVITIMVLEMKVPHGASFEVLKPLLPVFLSYVLSFTYIGIYWNNHHHMLHIAKQVNGSVLWANIHLLFWLSLFPFVTGWMGGIAYYLLAHCLAGLHGKNSTLAQALGRDRKGILSVVFYIIAIGLSFVHTWISLAIYVLVATIWFIPDRRMEKIYRPGNIQE